MKRLNYLLLVSMLPLLVASVARAQSPLTLNLSDTDGNGNKFDGVVLYSGNQYGDASIYARFGGSGTRYFEVLSPGENKNVVVQQDGFFSIRPTGNYVVDRSKILKFGGSSANISGSVTITARQLAINTYAVQESQPTPGARITTTYQTGSGTFPVELASGKFGVQLLDANGGYLRDLANPNDMNGLYTSRESLGYSKGDIRNITADLPGDLAPGTYKVRVVTRGLQKNVLGIPSPAFTIKAPVVKQTISTVSVSRGDICPGRDAFTVQFRLSGNPTTVYVAQLSDENGNFNNPKNIGSNKVSPVTTDPQTMGSSSPGTYKVRVIASDNSADWDGSSVSITFARSSLPVVNEMSYCASSPQPLRADGKSLFWYGISRDNQPYSGYNKAETPPSPTEPGFYRYQVTQTVDGCQSALADLKVTVKPKSSPPGDATREVCQNEPAQQLTTNAQNPIWAGGNSQAPTVQTGTPGTQTFKLSQETNGCRSDQSTITVRIKALPAAPGVTVPNVMCQFGPSQKLTASGNGLKWYRADGSLIGADAPTPNLGNVATQTYQVSQTADGCEGPKATIEQAFKAAPEKPKISPFQVCRLDPEKPLSATALSGHKLIWYGQSETGGTASATAPVITSGTALRTMYYVSQTQESTTCESLREGIPVVVANAPGPPSVNASQTVCLNTPPVSLTAGGDALFWTASSGGGLTSPEVAPVPPTSAAATYSYTVVQRLGTCVSPASTITFTVRPLPAAPVVKPLQIACINDASFTLSATALNGHKLTWYDNEQRKNPQSSVTVATGAAATKNWFVTQTDDNGCEGPATPQTSRILAKATARLYGDDEVYFFDSTAIRIQLGGAGPWNLTLWNDKVITNNLTNPLVVWVPPTTITRAYALKALSNECGTGTPSNNYEIRIVNRPVVTAVDPGLPEVSLTAYPNPVIADVRVDWRAISRATVVLRVLSITGSVVWQVERTATGAQQTETIQAGAWAAGVYTLQLQAGANRVESRLLKL